MIKAKKNRRQALFTLWLAVILLFSACNVESQIKLPVLEDYETRGVATERQNLKLGIVDGPYAGMFHETIEQLYAQKGYTVELVVYSNYTDPNFALTEGDIDMNMFQNYKYLNDAKLENNLDLSAVAEVPTAPMGIYSHTYQNLDEIPMGSAVLIPADKVNRSRALALLGDAGVIGLDKVVDVSKITQDDIVDNPKNLQFVPMEAHLLVTALGEGGYTLAIINGNYALSGGLQLSDSLFNEILTNHAYLNVIAVRLEDLGEAFVLDLIAVLFSEEFKDSITDPAGKYCEYQYPCHFSTAP